MAEEKKKRNPLVTVLKLIILVIAVLVGWKYGIGPLLSHQRQQPSNLWVVNDTDQSYDLSLGWRRLKRVLHPQSHVQFTLYVGMKEKQTLKVTPDGGGATRNIAVELAPNSRLLLNLDKATTYYSYMPERAHNERVQHLDALGRQLQNRQPPTALSQIVDNLRAIGNTTLQGSTDALFIDLAEYTPYILTIQDFSEIPAPGDRPTPLLTAETLNLTFANGQMSFNGAKPENTTATVKLDTQLQVPLSRAITVNVKPGTTLDIRAESSSITLFFMAGETMNVEWDGGTYSGSWSYHARQNAASWEWNWTFSGSRRVGREEWSLSLVVPHSGAPRGSIEKMDAMP